MKKVSAADKPTARVNGGASVTALMLGLWCAPAFASMGAESLCENSAVYHPLDLPSLDLDIDMTIDVVDHGNTDSINSINSGNDLSDSDDLFAPLSLTPPAETILRRIFDESLSRNSVPEAASPVIAPHAAPLAELNAPSNQEQAVDSEHEENSTADDELPGIATSLPGVSDEESLRYRRQMFRTDI